MSLHEALGPAGGHLFIAAISYSGMIPSASRNVIIGAAIGVVLSISLGGIHRFGVRPQAANDRAGGTAGTTAAGSCRLLEACKSAAQKELQRRGARVRSGELSSNHALHEMSLQMSGTKSL